MEYFFLRPLNEKMHTLANDNVKIVVMMFFVNYFYSEKILSVEVYSQPSDLRWDALIELFGLTWPNVRL